MGLSLHIASRIGPPKLWSPAAIAASGSSSSTS
jgi:hypothetical protein